MSKADGTVSYRSNAPLKSAWRGEILSTPKRPRDRACSTVLNAYVGDVLEKVRYVYTLGDVDVRIGSRVHGRGWDERVRRCSTLVRGYEFARGIARRVESACLELGMPNILYNDSIGPPGCRSAHLDDAIMLRRIEWWVS